MSLPHSNVAVLPRDPERRRLVLVQDVLSGFRRLLKNHEESVNNEYVYSIFRLVVVETFADVLPSLSRCTVLFE